MSSIEVHEYHIDDPLMPQLFMQSWSKPNTQYKGCLLITHGLAEHSECYDHVARALAEKDWFVYAWDMQGHGRSQGKRGYIRDFQDYSNDLINLIKTIKKDDTKPTDNFHLFGHSMGGLVTLQALCSDQLPDIQSATFSNPALGVAIEVPKLKEMASHWLNNIWPSFTMDNELRYEVLSRDPKMVSSYAKDPLRHNKISAPLYLGMVEGMKAIRFMANKIQTPLFFQISGQDKLIDPQASLDFYKNINTEKKLKVYEESYHEVYNDLNKQEAIDDLIEFLGEYSQ